MKVTLIFIIASLLVGCSKPIDFTKDTPTQQQVREYYGTPIVIDTLENLRAELFKTSEHSAIVSVFANPDSCILFNVDEDGTAQLVTKPLGEGWRRCISLQMTLCRQLHPDEDDGYWNCMSKGILSCTVAYTAFGWLCD